MPKAKPDQVIVHRIELQETERATLEAALAGRFVTNAVSATGATLAGLGSILAPFAGAISAMAALWLADRTFEGIKETIDDVKSMYESSKQANSVYQEMVAWLTALYSTSGFKSLSFGPGTNPANDTTRKAWIEQRDYVAQTYGPFDSGMLLKLVALACKRSKDGTLAPEATTPAECFVYETTLEEWQAWQIQFIERRR